MTAKQFSQEGFMVRRSVNIFILALYLSVFSSGVFLSVDLIGAEVGTPAQSPDDNAYLELSVDPGQSRAGSLITLHISYHNIGLPYTTINVNPSNLVDFDPPITMPCKYDQHPNGCQAIIFRTLSPGKVEFTASATGELWSEECQCWYWGGASDNGPAVAVITAAWRFFLPFVMD